MCSFSHFDMDTWKCVRLILPVKHETVVVRLSAEDTFLIQTNQTSVPHDYLKFTEKYGLCMFLLRIILILLWNTSLIFLLTQVATGMFVNLVDLDCVSKTKLCSTTS